MYPTDGRGMRLWRYQGANALGQRPRTLYLSLALYRDWETKRPIKLYYLIWKQNGRTKQR